jgi:hypothetical protein
MLAISDNDHGRRSDRGSRRSGRMTANSATKTPPIAHGARNMASWFGANRLTTKVAPTDAIGRQIPSTPETTRLSHFALCG